MIDRKEKVIEAIEWNLAMEQSYFDKQKLVNIFERCEELWLDPYLKKLHNSLLQENWQDCRYTADSLKESLKDF